MNITEQGILQHFVRTCGDSWTLGWHERNGGNLTYRMTEADVAACSPAFRQDGDWREIGVQANNLKGEHFIVTGSGKFFRNIPLAPAQNIGIVEINGNGDAYRIVWGLEGGGVPTSEFPSHFLNHSVKKQATDGANRVIYHAHTPALIALTYVLPLTSRDFSRVLWQSATECPVVFPSGVGVVEWMVPGGAAIAKASSELMRRFDAIVWAHHGLFCAGPDLDTAFGLMHTIEKAADIYVRAMSCGAGIRQTISDSGLRAIAVDFGVNLNDAFLEN